MFNPFKCSGTTAVLQIFYAKLANVTKNILMKFYTVFFYNEYLKEQVFTFLQILVSVSHFLILRTEFFCAKMGYRIKYCIKEIFEKWKTKLPNKGGWEKLFALVQIVSLQIIIIIILKWFLCMKNAIKF